MAIEVSTSQFRHRATTFATLPPHENRCDPDALSYCSAVFFADGLILFYKTYSPQPLFVCRDRPQTLSFGAVLDTKAELAIVLNISFS